MGSPEADCAAAEAVGTPESAFEELAGALQGWKRKVCGKKGGTPKRKDVTFVAPDGEEIKTKRQLDKYLKAHPGAASASDFEWGVGGDAVTPPENRRRSARLNSKGRLSGEGLEETLEQKRPAVKRSRKSRENGKEEKEKEKDEKEEKDAAAAGKEEAEVKSGTENGGHAAAEEKVEENGKEEVEESKAMEVEVPGEEVGVAEKPVAATAEGASEKAEEEAKVESEGTNGEKSAEVCAEASMKDSEESEGTNGEKSAEVCAEASMKDSEMSEAVIEATHNGDAEKASNGEGDVKAEDVVVGGAEGAAEGAGEAQKAETAEVGGGAAEAVA